MTDSDSPVDVPDSTVQAQGDVPGVQPGDRFQQQIPTQTRNGLNDLERVVGLLQVRPGQFAAHQEGVAHCEQQALVVEQLQPVVESTDLDSVDHSPLIDRLDGGHEECAVAELLLEDRQAQGPGGAHHRKPDAALELVALEVLHQEVECPRRRGYSVTIRHSRHMWYLSGRRSALASAPDVYKQDNIIL